MSDHKPYVISPRSVAVAEKFSQYTERFDGAGDLLLVVAPSFAGKSHFCKDPGAYTRFKPQDGDSLVPYPAEPAWWRTMHETELSRLYASHALQILSSQGVVLWWTAVDVLITALGMYMEMYSGSAHRRVVVTAVLPPLTEHFARYKGAQEERGANYLTVEEFFGNRESVLRHWWSVKPTIQEALDANKWIIGEEEQ